MDGLERGIVVGGLFQGCRRLAWIAGLVEKSLLETEDVWRRIGNREVCSTV